MRLYLQKACEQYQADKGFFSERYPVEVFKRPDSDAIVWKQSFTKAKGEFVAEMVLVHKNEWSPEELFLASLADCFVLSFRAISHASKLEWSGIRCECIGVLAQVGRQIKFTRVTFDVNLTLTSNEDTKKAERLLYKAEETCFISNSINCEKVLNVTLS